MFEDRGLIDADCSGPVVGRMDLGGAKDEDGLSCMRVTKKWAWIKMLASRSKIFSWFSYFKAKDFSL